MTMRLESLRVSADLDTSKYEAGMRKKVTADKAGSASSRAVGEAITRTDAKISGSGSVLERLSRRYVEGYAQAERFERALLSLNRGLETGQVPMEQAERILEGIQRKYGATANAAELAERGFNGVSRAAANVNTRLAAQASAVDATAAAHRRLATTSAQSVGLTSFEVNNLAAQFSDLGVQLASGQSPFMAIIQQGSQIQYVLGSRGGGVRGAISALGQGLRGFLNPLNLAVVGVAGLAAGAVALWQAVSDSESAEDALERQNKLLDEMSERV